MSSGHKRETVLNMVENVCHDPVSSVRVQCSCPVFVSSQREKFVSSGCVQCSCPVVVSSVRVQPEGKVRVQPEGKVRVQPKTEREKFSHPQPSSFVLRPSSFVLRLQRETVLNKVKNVSSQRLKGKLSKPGSSRMTPTLGGG